MANTSENSTGSTEVSVEPDAAPSTPLAIQDDQESRARTQKIEDAKQSTAAPVVVTGADSHALEIGDLDEKQKPRRESPLSIFLPNRAVSRPTLFLLIAVEALIALGIWITSPFKVLPQPGEVLNALQELWITQGLGQELATSFGLNLMALFWASVISIGLAYLTVIPLFRPLVAALSKGRFLSMVGFTLIFTLVFGGGRPLQIAMLTFGISVFYLTSMAAVIAAIPKAEFDHARTLRMSEWRVVWEVVILGTADKAFEVLRQNAAMGWMMLTLVEGIVRSEGGVGTMLLNENKHLVLPSVFAIQLLILIVGMSQDYAIGVLRRLVCPHADLTLERK